MRSSRSREWVDDDIAAIGEVEEGVFEHGDRFDDWMIVLSPGGVAYSKDTVIVTDLSR